MNHFKKTSKSLNKLRGIFFQLGLVIACGLSLLAFEWTSPISFYEDPEDDFDTLIVFTDLPPITYQDDLKKPEVKIIQPPKIIDIIDIIDNTTPNDNSDEDPLPDFNPDDSEPTSGRKVSPPKEVPFIIVEKMPEFIGGDKARKKYLEDNLSYPRLDKSARIEGTVYLNFIVNKKGEIKKVTILRGVSPAIDKEAIRVVKAMPNWSPGKQRGKAVNVSFSFRIKFKLK